MEAMAQGVRRLQLFGHVAFERDGTPVTLSLPHKALILLIVLACSGGRVLQRESLAERLWPDEPPADARANLRRHLHLVTKALGENALDVTPRTARWSPRSPVSCDVHEFEELLTDHPAHAIALYAGDIAAGVNDDLLDEIRRSYAERYIGALRNLCADAREAGDDERLQLFLQHVVAQDRFDEAPLRELMAVRVRLGDRAGALREYAALAARLKAELDVAPEPETVRLYESLLLAVDSEHAATNLPRPATSFVGREMQMHSLAFSVRSKRLITIAGPPGIGKTRLAVQLGWAHLKHFADGVWFVDVVGARDEADIFERLGAACGVTATRDEVRQAVCERLSDARALVIIDNCEHVVDAVRAAVGALQSQTAVHIVATSRRRLEAGGEVIVTLAPLPLPEAETTPEVLMKSAAARLFVDRASRAAPHLRVQHENVHTLAEIVRRLDGVPLAIELVASRANLLTIEGIAKRIRDMARSGSRSASERHRTIEHAIGWSYDLLSEPERRVFEVCSVFEGSWTLESLEHVLPGSFGDGFEELSELLESSLVQVLAAPPAHRYAMLQTTRQFAHGKLQQSGREAAVKAAHARHFAELVEAWYPFSEGTREGEYYLPIDADYANIRAGLEVAIASDPELAARFCATLYRYWIMRGRLQEGWSAVCTVRSSADFAALPVGLQGRFLQAYGVIARELGEADASRESLDTALECFSAAGDRRGEWDVLWASAKLDLNCGHLVRARETYRRCLQLQDQIGDEFARASAIANIGCVSHTLGEFDDAKTHYEDALAEYKRLEHTRGLAYIWRQLALIAREPHEAEQAVAFARLSVAMAKEIGEPVREADALVILAGTLNDLQRHEEALAASVQALEILERTAHGQFIMLACERIAETASFIGRPQEAARFHAFAQRMRERKSLKLWDGYQRDVDEAVASLKLSLAPEAFSAAWHAGEAMTVHDAVAAARRLKMLP